MHLMHCQLLLQVTQTLFLGRVLNSYLIVNKLDQNYLYLGVKGTIKIISEVMNLKM